MCWISKDKPIKRIAKKDIPVFKILKIDAHGLRSLYTNFEYKVGNEYSTEIKIVNSLYRIDEGFHSYSTDCKIAFRYDESRDEKFMRILTYNLSLDIPLDILTIYSDIKLIKANCIIPKGSEYYLNEKGEYVSNNIKIISIEDVLDNKE